MPQTHRAAMTAAFIVVGLALTPPAHGDTHTPPAIMDTLLVSTHLRPVDLGQSSVSATILEEEDIRRSGAVFLGDILRNLPGLAVSVSGLPGSLTDIRLRGHETRHTLVLINGVQVNNPGTGTYNFFNLLANEIERVEIIRGPQSVIHGADAVGGVIKITTTGTAKDALLLSAGVEGGSFKTSIFDMRVQGGNEKFNLDVQADIYTSGNTDISNNQGLDEKDKFATHAFNGRVGGRVGELDIDFSVRHSASNNDFDVHDFIGGFVSDVEADLESITQETVAKLEAAHARETDLASWSNTLTGTYHDWRSRVERIDLITIGGTTLREDSTITRPENSRRRLSFQSDVETDTLGASLLAAWEEEKVASENTSHTSLALELRHALQDEIFLSAGGRFENNERFDDTFSWRATAAWQVGMGRLYVNFATSVAHPTLSDLFGEADGFVPNPDLESESSTGYEIGGAFDIGSVNLNVAYFDTTLEDEITSRFNEDLTFTKVNDAGESERSGIELSSSWRASDALNLWGNYTYTKSEDPDGTEEIRRPEHTWRVGVDWTRNAFRASVDLAFTGEQKDNQFLSTGAESVTLDDYMLVGARLSYRTAQGTDIYLRVENLFDEDYEDVFSYKGRERGIFAGARARF